MSEEEAIVGYGINQAGLLPHWSDEEGSFMALVPESARFVADHLRAEAEAFARMTAVFYPDAHLTLGTPRRISEWRHNYPQDARQIFLVHAWILGEPPDRLRALLDVPLVPVGDWYHLDKLTALLAAYAGTDWTPFKAPWCRS